MGGGDLNLKKSWHPSTLRNIERVWKAEQKHDAEQRKIEQLQKELQDERAKEEIQQFAENHGVVKKKNERLDWMYQGPAALVDREQYLVGRSVDRTFEVLDQLESDKLPESDINQPGAIFSQSSVSGTIDLANKIREDPLFTIRKKETEQKKNLLNNPVKMKQLRELLEIAVSKDKKKHKKSKKHKRVKDDEDDQRKIRKPKSHGRDYNVREKRRTFAKDYGSEEENVKSDRKHSNGRNERRRRNRSASEDESSCSSDDRAARRQKNYEQQESSDDGDSRTRGDEPNRGKDRNESSLTYRSKPYGLILSKNAQHVESRPRSKLPRRSRSRSPIVQQKKQARAPLSPRRKLTAEEMEEKRRTMMEDAKWREEQRERNVKKYKKEDEKDVKQKGKPVDFIRPMLSAATDAGSVESRIRQKMFNLQRSGSAMNENFARK